MQVIDSVVVTRCALLLCLMVLVQACRHLIDVREAGSTGWVGLLQESAALHHANNEMLFPEAFFWLFLISIFLS